MNYYINGLFVNVTVSVSILSFLRWKVRLRSRGAIYVAHKIDVFIHSFRGGATTIVGAVVQLVEYRTRNREVAGSTHTRSTASNLEQVANLLRAQANSASYP